MTADKRFSKLIFLFLIIFCVSGVVFGQNQSQYPSETGNYSAVVAAPAQGGQDNIEVVFFEIPSTITSELYFAVKGASQINSVPDENITGTTTYYLIGGSGAQSSAASQQVLYADTSYLTGTPLRAFQVINTAFQTGTDPDSGLTLLPPLDTAGDAYAGALPSDHTTWVYFPAVTASQGELIGSKRYFKVVVVHSAAAGNEKNGFQLDVSLISPEATPREVPGASSFSYSRVVGAYNTTGGGTWNIHPFVPAESTGNIEFHNFDMDLTETLFWQNIDNSRNGSLLTLSDDAAAQNDIAIAGTSPTNEGSETKGTWLYQVVEVGGGQDPNPLEIWVENAGEPLRLYSSEINSADVPDPYRVVISTDTTAATTGASVEINLQIVDSSGTPVDYRQDIYVEAQDTDATSVPVISPDVTPAADDAEVITTDASGAASFTLSELDDGDSVTIKLTTNGDNDSDNFGSGPDDEVIISFADNPTPTVESLGDTTVEEGMASKILQRVVIEDAGTFDLVGGNTLKLRLNTGETVIFNATVPTVTVLDSAGGAVTGVMGAASRDADTKIFNFPITTTFGADDYLAIDGLDINATGAAVTSDQSFSLQLDYDGNAAYDHTDSRTITITDANATTYTYIGNDGDWTIDANWSPVGPPAGSDDSIIVSPTATAGTPLVLPETITSIVNLTIQGGAVFNLNGNPLIVTTTFSNDGVLRLTGSEAVTIANDTDSGTVEFTGSVDPFTHNLGSVYYGLTAAATAGTVQPTGALTINGPFLVADGTFDLNGQSLNVAGNWVVNGAAAFDSGGGIVTLNSSTANQTISAGGIDASHDFETLIIDTSNGYSVTLSDALAVTGNLTINASSILNLAGNSLNVSGTFTNNGTLNSGGSTIVIDTNPYLVTGNITTDNTPINFTNPVTLQANSIIDAGTGDITFSAGATVNEDFDLTLTSSGTITINEAMGGVTPINSLTVNGALNLGADITADGNTITFNSPVVVTDPTTLSDSGTGIYFQNTLDGDGGADLLTLTTTNGTSEIEFIGIVGGINPLGSLTINNSDVLDIQNTMSVTGNIDINSGKGFTHNDGVSIISTSGNITVDTTGANALSVNGSVITAGTGTIALTGSGVVTMDTDSLLQTANGSITVSSNGALTVDVIESTGAAAINLTATGGSIEEADNSAMLGAAASTTSLTLSAGTNIGNTNSLNTDVGSITATTSGIGNISIDEANAVDLVNVDTNNGSITVTAGGAVTATLVDSSNTNAEANDISITSTGAGIDVVQILAGAANANDVILDAQTLSITDSGAGITGEVLTAASVTGSVLDTDVGSITATTSGIGNISIDEANAVDLVNVDTTNGSITVTAGGAVTATLVDSSNTDAEANDISITSTGAGIDVVQILAGAANANDVILDAQTLSITDSGAGITGEVLTAASVTGSVLDTDVGSITATTSGIGNISIDEANAVDLVNVDTTNGSITVTAGGAVTATLVDSSNTNAEANDISITSTGAGIDVVQILAGAANANDVILDAQILSITDSGAGITGEVLTAASVTGSVLDTDVGSITATTSGIGNISIDEANAVDLVNVDTNNGSITVTAGGAVTATLVDSSNTDADANDISIEATAGNILVSIINSGAIGDVILTADTAVGQSVLDNTSVITADDLSINVNGSIGDITTFPVGAAWTAAGTPLSVNVNEFLSVTTTETGSEIYLSEADSASVSVAGAVVVAGVNAGDAIIEAGTNLVIGPGVAGITLTNGDDLSLDSGGTLTIPTSGLDTGTGDLVLSGATDIVDADRTLITGGNNMYFSSGTAGGDTVLTTSVSNLTAFLTAAGNLSVNETDGIDLVNVDTTNGSITVTAGGAVTATLV
ncbi:MAG: hypothetical protein JEY99_09560, partial [Spirochaetales bacterium]|nr:hypothetical protein [Spirochaetales bacterium]